MCVIMDDAMVVDQTMELHGWLLKRAAVSVKIGWATILEFRPK